MYFNRVEVAEKLPSIVCLCKFLESASVRRPHPSHFQCNWIAPARCGIAAKMARKYIDMERWSPFMLLLNRVKFVENWDKLYIPYFHCFVRKWFSKFNNINHTNQENPGIKLGAIYEYFTETCMGGLTVTIFSFCIFWRTFLQKRPCSHQYRLQAFQFDSKKVHFQWEPWCLL